MKTSANRWNKGFSIKLSASGQPLNSQIIDNCGIKFKGGKNAHVRRFTAK
jgi:hypothetical protein